MRVVAELLRLVRQIVRVDADAVTTHETWTEGQEIPLGAGGDQYLFRVDIHTLEDHGEFVDERDIHVTLCILDDLCRFGHLDARSLVRTGSNDAAVDGIDKLGHFRRRAGRHLKNRRQAMFLVTGVDALRAVADEEVLVQSQSRTLLQERHAEFFGGAGVYRRLVDDDVTLFQHAAQCLAGKAQRHQVRPLAAADRRRHSDDIEVAVGQRRHVARVAQPGCGGQFLRRYLQRGVRTAL